MEIAKVKLSDIPKAKRSSKYQSLFDEAKKLPDGFAMEVKIKDKTAKCTRGLLMYQAKENSVALILRRNRLFITKIK